MTVRASATRHPVPFVGYAQSVIQEPEGHPGPQANTSAALEEYIRNTVHSANAIVGTCRCVPPPVRHLFSQAG